MNETTQKELCEAVRRIAWGYLLLHFNLNLGNLNVLPNWAGYLLMLEALPMLSREVTTAALLRPLGLLLAGWEGLCWVLALFGQPPAFPLLSAAVTGIALYFHFQLLTDLATLARNHRLPQERRILRLRTVRTLLVTLMALPLPWERVTGLSTGMALVYMGVSLWICAVLSALRAFLWEQQNGAAS